MDRDTFLSLLRVAASILQPAGESLRVIGMAEAAVRRNAVANELLQFLHLRKSAFAGARPDRRAVDADFEYAAGAGLQRDFADFRLERREQFLRHPRRAQQPAALRAVFDLDARRFHEVSLPFMVGHERNTDESGAFGDIDHRRDIFEGEILFCTDENDRTILASAEQ